MTLAAALALSVPVAQTLAQPTAETAEAGSIATGQPVAYQSLDGSESLLITGQGSRAVDNGQRNSGVRKNEATFVFLDSPFSL